MKGDLRHELNSGLSPISQSLCVVETKIDVNGDVVGGAVSFGRRCLHSA